jgi:hypothetical protein
MDLVERPALCRSLRVSGADFTAGPQVIIRPEIVAQYEMWRTYVRIERRVADAV